MCYKPKEVLDHQKVDVDQAKEPADLWNASNATSQKRNEHSDGLKCNRAKMNLKDNPEQHRNILTRDQQMSERESTTIIR